jgi:hypothetical protein
MELGQGSVVVRIRGLLLTKPFRDQALLDAISPSDPA